MVEALVAPLGAWRSAFIAADYVTLQSATACSALCCSSLHDIAPTYLSRILASALEGAGKKKRADAECVSRRGLGEQIQVAVRARIVCGMCAM